MAAAARRRAPSAAWRPRPAVRASPLLTLTLRAPQATPFVAGVAANLWSACTGRKCKASHISSLLISKLATKNALKELPRGTPNRMLYSGA